jgi:hypothetical protein
VAGIGTLRRFYRSKEESAERNEEIGLMRLWRWKRDQVTGTPLPSTFPLLSRLEEIGYTTVEDLKGPTTTQSADIDELTRRGLARKEAAAVIAAMEDL